SSSITVALPRITAKQDVDIDVISKNEIFNLTTAIVDQKSQLKLDNIAWNTFTWSAAVSLYGSLQHQSNGILIQNLSSTVI
ncbi:unnamed protein product, partial [Rotaria magnacalcarata]